MSTTKTEPYTKTLKETMHWKSEILSKAQALWEVGMTETAQPLWLSAAIYEEHIAPMRFVFDNDNIPLTKLHF